MQWPAGAMIRAVASAQSRALWLPAGAAMAEAVVNFAVLRTGAAPFAADDVGDAQGAFVDQGENSREQVGRVGQHLNGEVACDKTMILPRTRAWGAGGRRGATRWEAKD